MGAGQALSIAKQAYGANHPSVATILNNIGELYASQGKYKQAEEFYELSLEILVPALGKEHPNVIKTVHNLLQVSLQAAKATGSKPRADGSTPRNGPN